MIDNKKEESIASKAQVRLDQELQASGFSQQDSSRDMQLYYYETTQGQRMVTAAAINEDEEESDEESIDREMETAIRTTRKLTTLALTIQHP